MYTETISGDQILVDPWREVVEELGQLSTDYCRKLQEEKKIRYLKVGKNIRR